MNFRNISLSTLAALTVASAVHAAAITNGNIVVSRVGDGSTALVNSGGAISILEYNTLGTVQQTIGITSTGASGLQLSGTASSEGALSLNGGNIGIAGYNPGTSGFGGTGSLSSRTATDAQRGYGTVAVSTGNYAFGSTFGTTTPAFSTTNIRSAVTTASGVYAAGGAGGVVYRTGTTNTSIQTQNANTRVANIINGNLYYSTSSTAGSTVRGIYGFTGVPTTLTTPTAIITGVTGQGVDANDFTFSSNGLTAYVADSVVGVQKFTRADTGSAFTLAYNITTATTGLTGLGVDFSGVNPVVYAVNPTNLFKYVDTGVSGEATSIATAGTNYAFRGLEVVPEPTSLALLGLGGLGLLRRRRA